MNDDRPPHDPTRPSESAPQRWPGQPDGDDGPTIASRTWPVPPTAGASGVGLPPTWPAPDAPLPPVPPVYAGAFTGPVEDEPDPDQPTRAVGAPAPSAAPPQASPAQSDPAQPYSARPPAPQPYPAQPPAPQPYPPQPVSARPRPEPAHAAAVHAAPPPIASAPSPYPVAPPVAVTAQPAPRPAPGRSDELRGRLAAVRGEVAKAVVGQDAAVTGLVIALLCRGHALLEGVPGVAKTLLVRSLSAALDLGTKRVQFTPDLMPGDITGSLVYDARTAQFSFREGPVFTNLLLADEINRTPPKTQAALLEAMEEHQVSVDGAPRRLPDPFLVIATQNPVEYEGTYPLPEAQLDRFLLKILLPLPGPDEEVEVLARHAAGFDPQDLAATGLTAVAGAATLDAARAEVAGTEVAREVLAYISAICRATRQSPSLSLGVSPRGATALLRTARAWAWLQGRPFVTPDDVKALAHPTLRHRVSLRAEAELEGVTAESVLDSVLAAVPVPR